MPWGQAEVEVTLVAYWRSGGWVTLLVLGCESQGGKEVQSTLGNRDLLQNDKKALGPKPAPTSLPLRWLLLLTSTLLYLEYLTLTLRVTAPPGSYGDFATTTLILLLIPCGGPPPIG
ncbi:MAG: hypothetical protein KIH08_07815 [Candidatus Freyarchaeota archaeon]|nr:hypothetical protein [Candidatus Jordarchaeia archaeon]